MNSPLPALTGLSHLDLSVSDRHASARWYAHVLGFEIRGDCFNDRAQLGWVHVVHPGCGLSMGLVEHPDRRNEPFDERRPGLDHVSFSVSTRADVEHVARRIRELGEEPPGIVETPEVVVLVLRDPDNIQVEVCLFKPPSGARPR